MIVARQAAHLLEGSPTPFIGPERWADTRVILPPDAVSAWRNVLSGSAIESANGAIAIDQALERVTVAILEADVRSE